MARHLPRVKTRFPMDSGWLYWGSQRILLCQNYASVDTRPWARYTIPKSTSYLVIFDQSGVRSHACLWTCEALRPSPRILCPSQVLSRNLCSINSRTTSPSYPAIATGSKTPRRDSLSPLRNSLYLWLRATSFVFKQLLWLPTFQRMNLAARHCVLSTTLRLPSQESPQTEHAPMGLNLRIVTSIRNQTNHSILSSLRTDFGFATSDQRNYVQACFQLCNGFLPTIATTHRIRLFK